MTEIPAPSPLASRAPLPPSVIRLHPVEKLLTGVLLLWLLFLPWAFGTMYLWSQSISLGLAGFAFLLALYPRELPPLTDAEPARRAAPWRTLVHLPLFWIALALFAYVAVQGLNPLWVYQKSETHWWLQRREAITWLPAGIEAPFSGMNAWRRLFIWSAALFAASAAWLGLTRRRSLQILAVGFVLNATLVAILGLAQVATGTKKIFWQFAFPGAAGPFGSFIYKNHAAAYLLVAFCVAGGLALWFHRRGVVHGAKSTPAPLFVFFGALLLVGIFFSLSRTGIVLAALGGVALLGMAARRLLSTPLRLGGFVALCCLLAGMLGWAVSNFDLSRIESRLLSLTAMESDSSAQLRLQAYEVTHRMIADYPLFGIGAGGFRHLSPAYAQDNHVITQSAGFGPNGGIRVTRMQLNESHSDLLQLVAEGGIIGGLLHGALLACVLSAVTLSARRRHPLGFSLLLAALLLLIFAAVDFPLHNPALLGSLALLLAVAVRWTELEPMTHDRRNPQRLL